MDRKEFLKSVCGLGVCGCALNLIGAPAPARAADAPAGASLPMNPITLAN